MLGRISIGLALSLLALPLSARAEDKVPARAEVVLASNQGAAVDPGLGTLKAELAKANKSFTSLKLLEKKDLSLEKGKDATVAMPGGRSAVIKLVELKNDVASVAVTITEKNKRLTEAQYTLARGKSIILAAGEHQGGVLLLVVSPPGGSQPRRLPPPERSVVLERPYLVSPPLPAR